MENSMEIMYDDVSQGVEGEVSGLYQIFGKWEQINRGATEI